MHARAHACTHTYARAHLGTICLVLRSQEYFPHADNMTTYLNAVSHHYGIDKKTMYARKRLHAPAHARMH